MNGITIDYGGPEHARDTARPIDAARASREDVEDLLARMWEAQRLLCACRPHVPMDLRDRIDAMVDSPEVIR